MSSPFWRNCEYCSGVFRYSRRGTRYWYLIILFGSFAKYDVMLSVVVFHMESSYFLKKYFLIIVRCDRNLWILLEGFLLWKSSSTQTFIVHTKYTPFSSFRTKYFTFESFSKFRVLKVAVA